MFSLICIWMAIGSLGGVGAAGRGGLTNPLPPPDILGDPLIILLGDAIIGGLRCPEEGDGVLKPGARGRAPLPLAIGDLISLRGEGDLPRKDAMPLGGVLGRALVC